MTTTHTRERAKLAAQLEADGRAWADVRPCPDAPRWRVRRDRIGVLWAWAATSTDCRHSLTGCRCKWFARHADAVAHADREARRP